MNAKIRLDIVFFNNLQITFPDITTTIAYFHEKSSEKVYYIPNLFFGNGISFVIRLFPHIPLFIECNIESQCTSKSKYQYNENWNKLHLNILIMSRHIILFHVTHLHSIKEKNESKSLTRHYQLFIYYRLSYFAWWRCSYQSALSLFIFRLLSCIFLYTHTSIRCL